VSSLAAPLGVFAAALAARAATAALITFPIPEGSAYYVAAAGNLATGRGLVVDVLWSYATPPFELPRPAFDLWQPLASLFAVPAMTLFGPSLASTQTAIILIGALAAPLAWLIARDAAIEIGLPAVHVSVVALGAGLLVAVTALLVVQSAEPDSSAPFTTLALAACWLVPRALAERRPSVRWRVLLGATIGLAYLTRQEAIYVAVAYLALAWWTQRGDGIRRSSVALAIAGLIVVPWLVRQAVTWQASPFAQLLENAWWVEATDIFAWSERPTLASHLALGLPGLVDLRLDAVLGNGGLLLLAAFPAAVLGLATLLALPRLAALAALRPVAIAAVLTFALDSLAFPVASGAGLYAHGAGPTIVLLAILAAFGADRAVHSLSRIRSWRLMTSALSPAALLAPAALVAVAFPLAALSATLEHERAVEVRTDYAALAVAVAAWDVAPDRPIVTDHPMWLAAALGRGGLALPREDAAAVADLARKLGARAVVVRDRDAEATFAQLPGYLAADGSPCFTALPAPPPFRAVAFTCGLP